MIAVGGGPRLSASSRNPVLDGIRALACLAVVAHHTGVPHAWAGWLGVDVFFVLSGYLITGLLLAERDTTGRVALVRFWIRRAGRLYPALVVAVALAALLTPWNPLRAAVALAYLGNLAIATGHHLGSLEHTWSLAVEEQFYICWPLAVLACRSRRALAWMTGGVAMASLGLCVTLAPPLTPMADPAYMLPVTRIWELLVGCLLALQPRLRVPSWLVLPGALTLAVAAQALSAWVPRDTVHTIGGTAIGVLLILAARQRSRWVSWLALPPLPAMGVISYGVYLFHFPFSRWAPIADLGPWWRFASVSLASLLLAALSYRLIEVPIRGRVSAWTRSRHRAAVHSGDLVPGQACNTVEVDDAVPAYRVPTGSSRSARSASLDGNRAR